MERQRFSLYITPWFSLKSPIGTTLILYKNFHTKTPDGIAYWGPAIQ